MIFILIYTFNVISIKRPTGFFVEIDNIIPKFIWKWRGPKIIETCLQKKTNVERCILLDIKVYDKGKIIRTTRCR